ncbi:hypothetical protein, partial [Paraburkholderia podalyriae]|uniref:hypothetical protein n=1 Tax=Paraburkholderia podalyriae TaxID=1938811 RepID=UPI001CA3FC2E
ARGASSRATRSFQRLWRNRIRIGFLQHQPLQFGSHVLPQICVQKNRRRRSYRKFFPLWALARYRQLKRDRTTRVTVGM